MEKKNKTTPLKVVRRESGYLLFSDSNTGKEGLESYLQHTADHFFDPHAHDGALEIYEYSGLRKELASHINSSCRRGLLAGGDRRAGMFLPVFSRQNSSTASNRNFTFP